MTMTPMTMTMNMNTNTVMTMIMDMVTDMVTAIPIKIREKHQEGLSLPPCQSPSCLHIQRACLTSMRSV